MFGWRKPSAKPAANEPALSHRHGAESYLPVEITGDEPASGVIDLSSLLDAIEALAGRIYADHGLPSQKGHYRRSGDGAGWDMISSQLTAAEKFDLILSAPDQSRYHYAAHDRLGAKHESPLVRQAAALLAASRGIQHKLNTQSAFTAQSLADCIRMGALYQSLAARIPGFETVDLIGVTRTPETSGNAP